ncbi:hypothetical protein BCR37DRAFT_379653 [Protomyces lactucae-debilis]|uniref:Uncharacterized protein n=1 Tax=Protomyces lactucae-debilis TaxID=2754530 RepID=A0A1Y2FFE3_PROLT|nr:uncharacterized protein BCR37DRAFT_379653 [Protomyces lactucae-debilis]ORY82639.1 hypothetical protein BCR37DRAFT_379653 [Protomyces lactucae-debilis]
MTDATAFWPYRPVRKSKRPAIGSMEPRRRATPRDKMSYNHNKGLLPLPLPTTSQGAYPHSIYSFYQRAHSSTEAPMTRPAHLRHGRTFSDWEVITHNSADPLLDLSSAQSLITVREITHTASAVDHRDAFTVVERVKPLYAAVAVMHSESILGQSARSSAPSPSPAPSPVLAATHTSDMPRFGGSPMLRVASALSLRHGGPSVDPKASHVVANGAYLDIRLKKSGKHYVAMR